MSVDNNLGMFLPTNATFGASGNYWLFTPTGGAPDLRTPTARDFPGRRTYLIRARIKLNAGDPATGWIGRATYALDGGHSFSTSYMKEVPAPTVFDNEGFAIVEFDMSALTAGGTDWLNGTIDQVKFEFWNNAAGAVTLDYVTFGKPGYGRNLGEVGKHDRAKGSLTKTAAIGNRILDDLIQDPNYWAPDSGTGITWTIDDTSADVTGSGATQLNLPAAWKSPTGNGTKTQATSGARNGLGRDLLLDVTPGEAIGVGSRVLVKSGFTGKPQMTFLYYEADGQTLLNGTGEGVAISSNDYRNTAAPAQAIFDLAYVLRVPDGARYLRAALAVDWPDAGNSQNAAQYCYFAKPFVIAGLSLAAVGIDADDTVQVATNTVGVWTTVASAALMVSEKLLSLDGTLYVRSSTAQAKGFQWRWRVDSTVLFTSGTFTTPAVSGQVLIPGDLEYEYIDPGLGPVVVYLEVSPTQTTNGNLEVIKAVLKAADDRTEL